MGIPENFKDLLPPHEVAHGKPDDRDDYLWVYDPQEAVVHVKPFGDHGYPIHDEMHPEITHPDRYQGYAYAIGGGWRIEDEDGHKVEDPYTLKKILSALKGEHPVELPHIRQHGDPAPHGPSHADGHA